MQSLSLNKKTLLLIGLIPVLIVLFGFITSLDGFPMGDLGAHIGEVYSIEKYGYLQPVPEWENGTYLAGIFYFPLSYWLGAVFLKIFYFFNISNPVTIFGYGLTILSVILLLYISFKEFNSIHLAIAFISLSFFNKISINTLFESTRMATVFSYVFFLLFLFFLISKLRKNKIAFLDFVKISIFASLATMTYANTGLAIALIFAPVIILRRELWKWIWVPILAFLPIRRRLWVNKKPVVRRAYAHDVIRQRSIHPCGRPRIPCGVHAK